jgi:transposase InsO family protein
MSQPTRKKKRKKTPSRKKSVSSYPFEFRLKAVRLYLEEGYSLSLINEELGVGRDTISKWAKRYREYGEDGLKTRTRRQKKSKSSGHVKKKIIEMKRKNPSFGVKRISDTLKRFFLIRTSPTTVRKTLSKADLIEPPKKKRRKNIQKPRFFERSTPNQMWQTDICTFRLAGKNAYLIGFIDDYSRYITSLGLYRSQTAEHVLETYRMAVGEYGVPKEMLTDNGRQYTNWRGSTRFEQELKKDRVKHLRSRPHHPMTLGKIERFWKSILNEFLFRAQFTSFEDARDRLNMWVKYYNYKRPHQGIKGLCPADRFFEIQNELRSTLEKGVEENALELALRGEPRDPFYMVGRMGDQSVVIRAEKGKVKMLVDGEDAETEKELVYDMKKENIDNEKKEENFKEIQSGAENQGGIVDLGREEIPFGSMPGSVDQLDAVKQLAEHGYGGHDAVTGSEKTGGAACLEQPFGETAGEESNETEQQYGQTGRETGKYPSKESEESSLNSTYEEKEEEIETIKEKGSACPWPCGSDHEGSCGADDSDRRSQEAWGVPQNIL